MAYCYNTIWYYPLLVSGYTIYAFVNAQSISWVHLNGKEDVCPSVRCGSLCQRWALLDMQIFYRLAVPSSCSPNLQKWNWFEVDLSQVSWYDQTQVASPFLIVMLFQSQLCFGLLHVFAQQSCLCRVTAFGRWLHANITVVTTGLSWQTGLLSFAVCVWGVACGSHEPHLQYMWTFPLVRPQCDAPWGLSTWKSMGNLKPFSISSDIAYILDDLLIKQDYRRSVAIAHFVACKRQCTQAFVYFFSFRV